MFPAVQVAWHDLAFFDPAMYESLRKVIVESQGEEGREKLLNMGLTFQVSCLYLREVCTQPSFPVLWQVSLRLEEGGGEAHELVPGGATLPVTPDNVYQYVKLYAELRMLRVCQEALLVS